MISVWDAITRFSEEALVGQEIDFVGERLEVWHGRILSFKTTQADVLMKVKVWGRGSNICWLDGYDKIDFTGAVPYPRLRHATVVLGWLRNKR